MSRKRKVLNVSKSDRDSVNSPELTPAWFKRARPAHEFDPKLAAAFETGKLRYRGQRGSQKAPTKERVSIRISREVLSHFRSKGEGWQTRIDRALMAFVEASR